MKKLPQDKIFFKSQNRNVFSVDPTLKHRRKQTRILLASAKMLTNKRRKPYKPAPDHPWRQMPFGKALYM